MLAEHPELEATLDRLQVAPEVEGLQPELHALVLRGHWLLPDPREPVLPHYTATELVPLLFRRLQLVAAVAGPPGLVQFGVCSLDNLDPCLVTEKGLGIFVVMQLGIAVVAGWVLAVDKVGEAAVDREPAGAVVTAVPAGTAHKVDTFAAGPV